MAQYWVDFEGVTTGTGVPTGWTEHSGGSLTNIKVLDVTQDGETRRVLEFQDGPGFITYDAISSTGDIELAILATITDQRGGGSAGVNETAALRIQSDLSGYIGGFAALNGDERIGRYDDGVITSLATSGGGNEPEDTLFWTRFNASGSTLELKFFPDSAPEPVTWDVTTTDTTYATGLIGVHKNFFLGKTRIFGVGIGTNGDTAPSSAPATGPNTPINPSITNLLATSARLNWEQG